MEQEDQRPSGYFEVVAVLFMLALYGAGARTIWRLLVDSFPGASGFLAFVFVVAGVAAAIAVIAFGASGGARAGWMQAERMLDDRDVEDRRGDESDVDAVDDSLERVALLVNDWHLLSSEERESAVQLLRVAAGDVNDDDAPEDTVDETLEEVTNLIDNWHALSPEDRERAVELLQLAASEADGESGYEDTVDETLEEVTNLIDNWHVLSPEDRERAVELLQLAAGEFDDVPPF